MPRANGKTWRHCRAKLGLTSNQAATLLDIKGGHLRQIETEVKPASLALAYRAVELYGVPIEQLIDEDQAADPRKEPDKKSEPKIEPTAPPRRQDREPTKGPKRIQVVA